jgi:hypothetical protein
LRQLTGWCCQKGAAVELVAAQEHIAAANEFDQAGAQEVAMPEHALFDRHARFGQGGQVAAVAAPVLARPLYQQAFGFRQFWRDQLEIRVLRIGRHLRRRMPGALAALPVPPAVAAAFERHAALAIEDAGPVLAGERDIVLAMGVHHRRKIQAIVALPAGEHQLAVRPAIVVAMARVVGRIGAEIDVRAGGQVHMHVRAQHDGSGAVPAAGRYEHATAAGGVAGRDGGGDGAVAVLGSRRGRVELALFFGRQVARDLHHLAWRRAIGGNVEVLLAKCERRGEAVNDRLRALPGVVCRHGEA